MRILEERAKIASKATDSERENQLIRPSHCTVWIGYGRAKKSRLTKRAADVWESARFRSIFLASGFFYISNIVHARPHAANANR